MLRRVTAITLLSCTVFIANKSESNRIVYLLTYVIRICDFISIGQTLRCKTNGEQRVTANTLLLLTVTRYLICVEQYTILDKTLKVSVFFKLKDKGKKDIMSSRKFQLVNKSFLSKITARENFPI